MNKFAGSHWAVGVKRAVVAENSARRRSVHCQDESVIVYGAKPSINVKLALRNPGQPMAASPMRG